MESNRNIGDIVAANVLALKRHSGLAQRGFAKKCGLGEGTINRILNADSSSKIKSIEKIAHAFKLEPWKLLVQGFDPDNTPVLRSVSKQEEALYKKIKSLLKEVETKQ